MTGELANSLRAWRDRLRPTEVGSARDASRRAPGLRREEVAAATGISVNYLTRLEQGRARTPSPSVTASLARALRLNPTETEHLHRLAGHADRTVAARHITPSIMRILDRFEDVPMIVIDPAWTIVQANAMAQAMLGHDLVGENSARRQFFGPDWVHRDPAEAERFEQEIADDLHLQLARHPDDPALNTLIDELRAGSERFCVLWTRPPTAVSASSRKTFEHPVVGTITVDCDHLEVVGSDLRIVVWTAPAGSPDAGALKLLSVVGSQQFDGSSQQDSRPREGDTTEPRRARAQQHAKRRSPRR